MKAKAVMGFLPSGWSSSTAMKLRSLHLIIRGEVISLMIEGSQMTAVVSTIWAFRMMQVLPKKVYLGLG